MGKRREVIVVGGGLAGLSAAMKCAEFGFHVKLVCVTQAKRSHSVCAQGGINASINVEEGDSPLIHAYETIKGGDFLADQPPVVEMCLAAPAIINMMARLGCPFNRTKEGDLEFRRFGGSLYRRTAFCGATTGQQLLYSLDEQVRRYESLGLVQRFENHEFMRLVLDEQGLARGIVLMDLRTLQLAVLQADSVIMGTGGLGMIFKKSTNSTFCSGAASGRLYRQGAYYANGEFIQIHPTAIPGSDKLRLISESSRGEGGRVWVYGDSSKSILTEDGRTIPCGRSCEPWYFLEELYPAYGNLVPRDIAAREILRICEMGLGVEGGEQVFLDVTHLPAEKQHSIEAVLEIYQKFTGEDPRALPMKIFPAVHYSMGGIWVDWPAADDADRATRFRQMSNIAGCFNVGESEFLYHGANRLGANSLLSCIFAGLVAAGEQQRYFDHLERSYCQIDPSHFSHALAAEEAIKKDLLQRSGKENVHALHSELSEWMVKHVTVKRNNRDLLRTKEKIRSLQERCKKISLDDRGSLLNQTYTFANQFQAMLDIALVIVEGAYLRDEFRGAHYKPEFPQRDDTHWLKTTMARFDPAAQAPSFFYRPVDLRHVKPSLRKYAVVNEEKPVLENVPQNIVLPI